MTDVLFSEVIERGRVRRATSDLAWVTAMLDFERALAVSQATLGIIPGRAAAAIAVACESAGDYDLAAISHDTAGVTVPVIPLLDQIRARLDPAVATMLHFYATSQDAIDTAAMIIARNSIDSVLLYLTAADRRLMQLATASGNQETIGRTLLQYAVPMLWSDRILNWRHGLTGAIERLSRVQAGLPVQLGGPVGILERQVAQGPELIKLVAKALGLAPSSAWHTMRLPVADLAGALATACGVIAKISYDLLLLAQQDVGEARETHAGRGRSSSMPHKHNSTAAISANASARRAPANAAHLLGAMMQEHERAAGAWQSEWRALVDLLRCTGSAAAWLEDCLEHTEIDFTIGLRSQERMP